MFAGTPVGPRVSEPIVYDPVGRCIYCGRSDVSLTREHIIPLSLAGTMILPKSSCQNCAAITGKFEGEVARSIFGNFRMKHNLPTRRPKQRPSHITLPGAPQIDVPVSTHPAPLFLYKCTRAGILDNLPPDVDRMPEWQMLGLADTNELNKFNSAHGQSARFLYKHIPEPFGRMLAKIGYAYAVASIGIETFIPLIQNVIVGREKNISRFVGGQFDIETPVTDAGHLTSIEVVGRREFLPVIAHIRLFASIPTPTYHAVVGVIRDEAGFQKVMALDKMRRAQSGES